MSVYKLELSSVLRMGLVSSRTPSGADLRGSSSCCLCLSDFICARILLCSFSFLLFLFVCSSYSSLLIFILLYCIILQKPSCFLRRDKKDVFSDRSKVSKILDELDERKTYQNDFQGKYPFSIKKQKMWNLNETILKN